MIDELERDLRAANPLQSRRSDALSARAEADLASILAAAPAPAAAPAEAPVETPQAAPTPIRRIRRSRIAWALSAAAVLVVTSILTVTSLNVTPEPSVASLPGLEATPIDATLPEVIAELSAKARALPGDADPGQVIDTEEWTADITVGGDGTTFFVQPQLVHREWYPDHSGVIESIAGEVRWGDAQNPAGAVEPGTLLSRMEFGPGEYGLMMPDGPPDTADALHAAMDASFGYGADTPTGWYFSGLYALRTEWALTGPQAAAVLEFIGTLPDVELLGEVTDRLGRTGIALATETAQDGAFRDVLVFDPETGNIISYESTYLGGHPDIDLPVDSVQNFTAWKTR